jgi:hypothetical protein
MTGYKVDEKVSALVKAAVLKNPKLSHPDFIKIHPKLHINPTSFLRLRYMHVAAAGREDELPLRAGYDKPCSYDGKHLTGKKNSVIKNKKRLYSTGWTCPLAEFNKHPIESLQSFLEAMSAQGRSNFELIKVDKMNEEKWTTYLEVREGKFL